MHSAFLSTTKKVGKVKCLLFSAQKLAKNNQRGGGGKVTLFILIEELKSQKFEILNNNYTNSQIGDLSFHLNC